MALNCDPNELALAAKCFQCLDDKSQKAIELYLMALIAGVTPDPEALQAAAKAFKGIGKNQWQAMVAYLTCLGAGGISYSQCLELSGAGSPIGSQAPQFIGQLYHNTVDDTYWRSTGLTNADWVQIAGGGQDMQIVWKPAALNLGELLGFVCIWNGVSCDQLPGITEIEFLCSSNLAGFNIQGTEDLQILKFTNLTQIGSVGSFDNLGYNLEIFENQSLVSVNTNSLVFVRGGLDIDSNPLVTLFSFPLLQKTGDTILFNNHNLLTSISMPSLTNVGVVGGFGGALTINLNPQITSLSFPSLVAVAQIISFDDCASLSSVSLPAIVPTNGKDWTAKNCNLSQASVDHILARCVANPAYVSGTVDLSGGTNSAPSSLAPGSDYAILVGRGVTVTVNP